MEQEEMMTLVSLLQLVAQTQDLQIAHYQCNK